MNATELIKALDDSDLDTYEIRYLLRVWRRRSFWEKARTLDERGVMSKSQAYRVKTNLIEKGWIVEAIEGGRVVQRVVETPPTGAVEAEPEAESIVEFVPVGDKVVPVGDKNVPDRDALPINSTKESNKDKADAITDEPEPALTPVEVLRDYFHESTLLFWNAGSWEASWRKPLEAILHHAGGDVERGKKLIDQAIEFSRGENRPGKPYPIMSPKSIVNIVANLAAEQAAQKTTIDADALFEQALAVVKSGTITGADPLLARIIRAVGWPVIQQSSDRNQDEIKRRLVHEYRAAVAAAA